MGGINSGYRGLQSFADSDEMGYTSIKAGIRSDLTYIVVPIMNHQARIQLLVHGK